MASKFDGDVRPLSNDQRYMGVVFSGSIKNALKQARSAPEHGLSEQYVPPGISRNRAALLEHLNLLDKPKEPAGPGFYTLEYALRRWPENFREVNSLEDRLAALTPSQSMLYQVLREHHTVAESLARAEAYPYPYPAPRT